MTIWFKEVKFPAISIILQVTVVVPKGKLAGSLWVIELTLQLSLVAGNPRLTPVKAALHDPESAPIVKFVGATPVGGVISLGVTSTNWVSPIILPSVKVVDIVTE